MTASSELTLGQFCIESAELQLPDYVMVPFEREDRLATSTTGEDRPHTYRQTVATAARRLDILGYSLPAAGRAYERGAARLREPQRQRWTGALLGPNGFEEWRDAMQTAFAAAQRNEHIFADATDDARLRTLLTWTDD